MYQRELKWVYDRIGEMCAMHPEVADQAFFDRVKEFHAQLPQWVFVDDV